MNAAIDCFTSYYIETGAAAVCGVVLSDGAKKTPALEVRPAGDYLNGLLELLIERIECWQGKLGSRQVHLRIHIHHKNTNFKAVLDKSIKAAKTGSGYQGSARDHIIKHTLTRKDYKAPACYERMDRLARALIEINDPDPCLEITTCWDSRSSDQLAVYTLCQGEWHQSRGAANDGNPVEEEVAVAGN
jgi:hypothetical protein